MPTTILDGETYEQARHRRFTEEAKVIEKMQQDEIIRMARETGIRAWHKERGSWFEFDEERLLRFAALVAAHEREKQADISALPIIIEVAVKEAVIAEREACAKVCEDLYKHLNHDADCRKLWPRTKMINDQYAAAIRARTT